MDKIHALIIDDDRDTANLFSMVLTLVGFQCEVVYSAKTALAYLATNEPDIVLLDMRLGLEISGTDILYQIRSTPRFDKMRVIVITAYPHLAAPVHNLADLVMLKPVDVENLQALASRLTEVPPKSFAFRDPVTNLYNLNFFLTRLEHAFERMKRNPGLLFAVMVIEFDFTPPEREKVYYPDRENLLKIAAEQLTRKFRPTDTFGRMDGERIVALYEDLKQTADVQVIIQRLLKELPSEYMLHEQHAPVLRYIGAALNTGHYQNAEDILRSAMQALDSICHSEAEGFLVAEPLPE